MKRCPICGAENDDKNKFCWNCGHKFKIESASSGTSTTGAYHHSLKAMIISSVALIAVAIMAFAAGVAMSSMIMGWL